MASQAQYVYDQVEMGMNDSLADGQRGPSMKNRDFNGKRLRTEGEKHVVHVLNGIGT